MQTYNIIALIVTDLGTMLSEFLYTSPFSGVFCVRIRKILYDVAHINIIDRLSAQVWH